MSALADPSVQDWIGQITNDKIRVAIKMQQDALAAQKQLLEDRTQKSNMFSLSSLVVTICGFFAGLAAVITFFNQMGLFNIKDGIGFEGKQEASAAHAEMRTEYKALFEKTDEKLDILIQRIPPRRK